MKTALVLYNSILREIDKYSSASFEVADFVYFYNKATQQYVNQRYGLFEMKQQLTDDLRILVVPSENVVFNATTATNIRTTLLTGLSQNYLHLLNCIVNFEYKTKLDCNGIALTQSEACKRLDADKYAFIINNTYLKPDVKRPYSKIAGTSLSIVYDTPNKPNTEVVIKSVDVEYLREPLQITLNADYTGGNTSEFPDYVDLEIVNICTKLFLENIEQQRLQTNPLINQTIN